MRLNIESSMAAIKMKIQLKAKWRINNEMAKCEIKWRK
jgi:hypothetical protein